MKNNTISFQKLDTMRRNLDMLESSLGYPVPQHLLNGTNLSKNILSLRELDTLTRNIRMLDYERKGAYSGGRIRKDLGLLEWWPTFFVIFLFLVYLFS